MKSFNYVLAVLVFAGVLSGCTSMQQSVKKTDETIYQKTEKVSSVSLKSSLAEPFDIYTEDGAPGNHYCPSGWMGDINDLKIDGGWTQNPHSGNTCFKISYSARSTQGWAGIYWQEPANNWGTVKGGFDLTGATRFTFWIRGEKGGEKIGGFTIGGILDGIVSSDTAKASMGAIVLAKEWTQYTIDLLGKDMSNIISGLSFSVGKGDNPYGLTFFLDDVRYE